LEDVDSYPEEENGKTIVEETEDEDAVETLREDEHGEDV
jgi:hypothetical protein